MRSRCSNRAETCSYEPGSDRAEALAATENVNPAGEYAGQIANGQIELISWTAMWRNLLADLRGGRDVAHRRARFMRACADPPSLAARLAGNRGIDTVVLGGGVFQNRLLLEAVTSNLEAGGLRVLSPRLLPANDGGISLGQGAIAAARALCR
jgi:hydrogenase maturation protein HypF